MGFDWLKNDYAYTASILGLGMKQRSELGAKLAMLHKNGRDWLTLLTPQSNEHE